MKRLLIYILILSCTLSVSAQKKSTAPTKKPQTTKTVSQKKNTASQKKSTTNQKKAAPTISGLKKEREQIQKKIKQQEQALKANIADVAKRLKNLLTLNSEIRQQQKTIDGIQGEINQLDQNINLLQAQIETLEKQLQERKDKFVKSMRYMNRNRSVQDRLMFIFSADNFTQMYRRIRFVQQYASFQRVQGEQLKLKQEQIAKKKQQLEDARREKNVLLSKGKQAKNDLQTKQGEQESMVKNLQRQQKTIQGIIDQQKKKDAALNAQIDRMIAAEVARAKAEAKRKAEAAEAAKRKQEELGRKKAAAEAAERENAKRLEEARKREADKRAAAKAAEGKSKAEQERAQQEANRATAEREAIERKNKATVERNKKELAEAKKNASDTEWLSANDRKLSGGFEQNKGRLPVPITGSYRIVSHFGQYNVEGLKGVTLDNKGINILGKEGCQARSIYDGEVSAVFGFGGSNVVMVRHGAYISVYCNLRSVNVHRGQKVSARQVLGTVGQDNILQFQLRRETAKLNPEVWIGK